MTTARRHGLAVLAARYAAGSDSRPEEQRCRRSSLVDPVGGVNIYWQTADWLERKGLAAIFGWDGTTSYVRLTRLGIERARLEGFLA